MKRLVIGLLHEIIIIAVRPYIVRELPGWGKIYRFFVGDYRRNWFWVNGPVKRITDKRTGYTLTLDLSQWADRSTFFLGRWVDLEIQLMLADVIRRGDTVIDIGANRGMFALSAAHRVGEEGKVICFEPNPKCAGELAREIAANEIKHIVINHCGLADEDGELTLTVPLINSGEGSFAHRAFEGASYQVRAKVYRGDDLLGDETPSLIKIDVEGFESKVIAGMKEMIQRCRPIIITELIAGHLEASGSSTSDFITQFNELGYFGFRLGLYRGDGHYSWSLRRVGSAESGFDVVWLPKKMAEPYATIVGAHIQANL